MLSSIFQRYADNLLIGATATATPAPMTSYDEATLLTHRPSARVRWNGGSPLEDVRIRFDLLASGRADVFVIPVWNADAGSPSVARLTSDAGMDVAISVPAMMPSGIPRTTAVDLTTLELDAAKRTSDGFDLVITGNSVPLIIGGAVLLYGPKRTLADRDWQWGYSRHAQGLAISHDNLYGTDLVNTLRTRVRSIDLATLATDADALAIEEWADANFGNGLPGLVWPIPDVREAYFARMSATCTQKQADTDSEATGIALTFTELSKGKPVA